MSEKKLKPTIGSAIADTFYAFTGHAQGEYYYYVRGHNTAFNWGEFSCLEKADVTVGIAEHTPVDPGEQEVSLACTPNPFRGRMTIHYHVPEHVDHADIRIYDVTGQLMRTIPITDRTTFQQTTWQGTDSNGSRVSAGVYFVQLNVRTQSGGYECKRVEKITLLQ